MMVLTDKVLEAETWKVVYQSNVCQAVGTSSPNWRAGPNFDASAGELRSPGVHAPRDAGTDANKIPIFAPDDLIGLSILREQENGSVTRATVAAKIIDRDAYNHQKIKFHLSLGDGELEELISYGELSDLVEKRMAEEESNPDELYYAFKSVEGFSGRDEMGPDTMCLFIGMMGLRRGNRLWPR